MSGRLLLSAGTALVAAAAIAVIAIVSGAAPSVANQSSGVSGHEVWALDQTDSRTGYGGFLHIFNGNELIEKGSSAQVETIDLAGNVSEFCFAKTGANPVRPHMLAFNGGDVLGVEEGRFAIISWVVSGHVTIHDARTREILECIRTTPGSGGARQAHAAWPTPDEKHLVVANQNGKLVQRIRTDYKNRQFALEPAADLSLFQGNTPGGVPRQDPTGQNPPTRPDNAPICVRPTYDGRFSFVSLRGGGAFVVDHNATPMRIVAEYDQAQIDDNGCGQIEADGKMFFNSGSGTNVGAGVPPGDPFSHDVYAVTLGELSSTPTPPNTPTRRVIFSREGRADGHGFALARDSKHLLAVDRERNDITIVDTEREVVTGRAFLEGELSSDPAPDLASPAPGGDVFYVTLRSPNPLTGGGPATGNSPGLGVVKLTADRTRGRLTAIAPTRRTDSTAPDPHGLNVRLTGAAPSAGGSTAAIPQAGQSTAAVPPPPTPTATSPRARPELARAALRFSRKGTVSVRVKGPNSGGGRFRGTVHLEAGDRILGRRAFAVTPDQERAVAVKLSRFAKRKLASRKGRLSTRVVVSAATEDGVPSQVALRTTILG